MRPRIADIPALALLLCALLAALATGYGLGYRDAMKGRPPRWEPVNQLPASASPEPPLRAEDVRSDAGEVVRHQTLPRAYTGEPIR